MYDEGISRSLDVIDVGVEVGVLQKQGTWLAYGDVKLGQGRDNARAYLRENPKLMTEIEAKVRSLIRTA